VRAVCAVLIISVCFRYHICDIIVKPVTFREKCSIVELVAHQDRQDPIWFVSHFWGTPYDQTVQMLSFHAEVHNLGEDTTYWYCTLANVSRSLPGVLCCAVVYECFVAEPARPEPISRRPSTDTLLARDPVAELRRGGPSNGFQMHPTKEDLVCARGVYSLHTCC